MVIRIVRGILTYIAVIVATLIISVGYMISGHTSSCEKNRDECLIVEYHRMMMQEIGMCGEPKTERPKC